MSSNLGFTQPIAQVKPKGEEFSPWYWNPANVYAQSGPAWFMKQLNDIDPDLNVTWNPINERWQVWVRKPSIKAGRGWLYLFPVQTASGDYLPLDERTFAKIHEISARKHGSSKKYFDAVVREQERDRELAEKAHEDEVRHKSYEYYGFTQPHVGYGPLTGSKVVGQ